MYTWECRRRRLRYLDWCRRQGEDVQWIKEKIESLRPETDQAVAYRELEPGWSNAEWGAVYGLPARETYPETPFGKAARWGSRAASKQQFLARLALAAMAAERGTDPAGSSKQDEPWYAIFWTLTLDPSLVVRNRTAFSGRPWLSWRKARVREGVRYAAVVEEPEANPHMHVLTWHKDLPPDWRKDPWPLREITAAKATWAYGFSSPRPMRLSGHDAWAVRAGHQWPKDLTQGGPAGLAGYLGKYLMKSEEGGTRWRMTQRLGTAPLEAWCKDNLTAEEIRAMADNRRWPPNSLPHRLRTNVSRRLRMKNIENGQRVFSLMRASERPGLHGRVIPDEILRASHEVTPDEMSFMLFEWLGRFDGAKACDEAVDRAAALMKAWWTPPEIPTAARPAAERGAE